MPMPVAAGNLTSDRCVEETENRVGQTPVVICRSAEFFRRGVARQ